MNPQFAYESVQQTLRILIPELIVLAVGIAMMTAAPFFRWPRRTWCAIGQGRSPRLCWHCWPCLARRPTDTPRLPSTTLWVLRPTCRSAQRPDLAGPGSRRAGRRHRRRVLRRIPDDQRGCDAGDDRERAGLPFRGPRAGQHSDVPAALPHAPDVHDPGGRDQVFLPQHLLLGIAALRPGIPVWRRRSQQSQGAGHSVMVSCLRSPTRSLA